MIYSNYEKMISYISVLEEENETLKEENKKLEDSLTELIEYIGNLHDRQEDELFEEDFAID